MPVLDATDLNSIWGRDIDPGATTYSASGSLWTIMQRTSTSTNTQLPQIIAKLDDLEDKLDIIIAAFSSLPGADLNYIKSKLDELTEDPAVTGHSHPVVAAVEWADVN